MTTKVKLTSTEVLSDIYELHVSALASKAIQILSERYPDMSPEELLVISLVSFLVEDDELPMGSTRQQLLEASLDYLKENYGDDSVEFKVDVDSWDRCEDLASVLRKLVPIK